MSPDHPRDHHSHFYNEWNHEWNHINDFLPCTLQLIVIYFSSDNGTGRLTLFNILYTMFVVKNISLTLHDLSYSRLVIIYIMYTSWILLIVTQWLE